MPRNGTGGYSLPNNSWNPAINGAAATAGDWQALINDVATAIQNSVSSDGQTSMTGSLNMGGFVVTALGAPSAPGQSLRWEQMTKGPDIASAANISIPIEGTTFSVTGTTQINTITDVFPGRIAYLIFASSLTLKNSANFVMPGGLDVSTAAGDVFAVLNESPGVWRVISYPNRVAVQNGNIVTGGFKNKLINSLMLINQRGVSGTVVLAPGQYGHDRFKAGAAGCTYTFVTGGGFTTLAITAGTLAQVVEGSAILTGVHTLSWRGTAQGRINALPLSAAPVTTTLTGGTNVTVEFGTGTLALPQLEIGTYATPSEVRPMGIELSMARRYFRTITFTSNALLNAAFPAGASIRLSIPIGEPMRISAPTLAVDPPNWQVYDASLGFVAMVLASAAPESGLFITLTFTTGASIPVGSSVLTRNTAGANCTLSAEL